MTVSSISLYSESIPSSNCKASSGCSSLSPKLSLSRSAIKSFLLWVHFHYIHIQTKLLSRIWIKSVIRVKQSLYNMQGWLTPTYTNKSIQNSALTGQGQLKLLFYHAEVEGQIRDCNIMEGKYQNQEFPTHMCSQVLRCLYLSARILSKSLMSKGISKIRVLMASCSTAEDPSGFITSSVFID